ALRLSISIVPHPPFSPLFPYTTLFRSSSGKNRSGLATRYLTHAPLLAGWAGGKNHGDSVSCFVEGIDPPRRLQEEIRACTLGLSSLHLAGRHGRGIPCCCVACDDFAFGRR